MRAIILTALVIFAFISCENPNDGELFTKKEYTGDLFRYRSDGTREYFEYYDNLVTLRINTESGLTPDDIAQKYSFIETDTAYFRITLDTWTFNLTNDLSEIGSLYDDPDILMVNFVIKTNGNNPVYISNQIISVFRNNLFQSKIDSILESNNLILKDLIGSEYYCVEYTGRTTNTTIDICNQLFLSGYFDIVQPNFLNTNGFEPYTH